MSQQIRTILVDDEINSNVIMKHLLEKNAPDIEIVGVANNVKSAVEIIDEKKPDLIFLDISMPDGDGFEVIEKTEYKDFQVIFVTAYDQYAIKAFEVSALHYLLKPVVEEDLIAAIERFQTNEQTQPAEQYKVLTQVLNSQLQRLILPTSTGIHIVDIDEIIRCESNNNYTTFFLTDNSKVIVSKSIHLYEDVLNTIHFCRIHNKHIINLKYVKKYVKGRGGKIYMSDGTQLDVSDGRKADLLYKLNQIAINK